MVPISLSPCFPALLHASASPLQAAHLGGRGFRCFLGNPSAHQSHFSLSFQQSGTAAHTKRIESSCVSSLALGRCTSCDCRQDFILFYFICVQKLSMPDIQPQRTVWEPWSSEHFAMLPTLSVPKGEAG